MLTYLLGDVLRIFAGDMTPGEMDGKQASQGMWLLAAVIMLVPIVMVVLSLTVQYPALYDNFLIIVGLVFNAVIIWYAWTWMQ